MKVVKNFLKLNGRISRGHFWLGAIAVLALFMVSNLLLPLSVRGWVASPLALFALVCLSIRRFHDRDRSGWSLLWVLLPIIGAGWVVWQVALRRGVADDNRWGTDPLLNRADFLVVR